MLSTIILLLALGFFVFDAVGYKIRGVSNMQSVGLACLVVSMIVRF